MKTYDIPERWQTQLYAHIQANTSGPHRDLGAIDFTSHIQLRFMDESSATFRYAFHLTAPERDELLVITEHCLHHIFPLHGTEIKLLGADAASA